MTFYESEVFLQRISTITFEYVLKALTAKTKLSMHEMLAFVNLKEEDLENNPKGIESHKLSDIFRYCIENTQNKTLALDIGQSISYHSLGLLGYLLLNTQTLKEMIEKFAHYQQLVGGYLKFHFSEDEHSYKFTIFINENPYIPVPSYHAEVHLSAIVSILTQILGQQVVPSQTFFSQEKVQDLTAYHKLFGENIFFNKDENSILFNKNELNIPVKNSNPSMLGYFENQANAILQDLNQTSYYGKVKTIILKNIGEHDINIEFVASQMQLSVRTLQNYLKSEKKNFRDAFTAVRMQLADHYLKTTKMDYSSIAFLLGYSEASSFFRAYKKWTNKTPSSQKKGIKKGKE